MTSRLKRLSMFLPVASILLCALPCASQDLKTRDYTIESVERDRMMLLEKLKSSSEIYNGEISRRASDTYREKIDFNRKFYDDNILETTKDLEEKDTQLTRVILDFIDNHPRDKYLPFALFKLAQLYFESANAKHKRDLEAYYDQKNPPSAAPPKKDLSYSIAPLLRIKKEFPDFANIDSSLYLLGYAYLESGDPSPAQENFYALVEKRPGSPYIEEAFLRLGEFYFAKKNFDDSIKSYKRALKTNTGNYFDKITYKLAWAYYLTKQYSAALENFSSLLDWELDASKDSELLREFQKDAQMYVAFSLFRKKNIDNAVSYLGTISSKPYAYAIGKNLGDIYFDRGFFNESVLVYKKLISDYPGNVSSPLLHKSVLRSYENTFANNKLKNEWEEIISFYSPGSGWRIKNLSAADENKIADELLEYSLYSLAVLTDKSARQSNSEPGLLKAIDYYHGLIKYFPSSEKAYHAQYYASEAYLSMKRLEDALVSFDSVLKNNYYNRYFIEGIYSEIVVYEKMIAEKGGLPALPIDVNKNKKQEITGLSLNLLETCDLFLEKSIVDERSPLVYYRSAEILDHFNHNSEAEKRYNYIIDNYPETKFAQDSFRKIINLHVALEDWSGVISKGERYLDKPYLKDEKLKGEIYQVSAVAHYKAAKAALDSSDPITTADYLKDVSIRYTDSEILTNIISDSFESYKKSTEYGKACAGMLELLKAHPKSSLAPKILMELARIEDENLNFEQASHYYTEVLDNYASSPFALDSLLNLALLNEGTGESSKAADFFYAYSGKTGDDKIKKEAFLKAILNYSQSGNFNRVLKIKSKAEDLFSADPEKLAMLYLIIAKNYRKQNSQKKFLSNLATAEKILRKVRIPIKDIADLFYDLKIQSIKPDLERFKKISLSLPRKTFLSNFEKKALLLKKIEAGYMPVIKNSSMDYAACALNDLGNSYEDFGKAVLETRIPGALDQAQSDKFKEQFSKIADPLLKKGRSAYIKNITESKNRKFFNACVNKSMQSFAAMIESQSMKTNMGLDFKYRYQDDLFTYPVIEDVNKFRGTKDAYSGYSKRKFADAVSLSLKPDSSRQNLKDAAALFDLTFASDKTLKEARFNKAVVAEDLGNYDAARFIYYSFTGDDALRKLSAVNLAAMYYRLGDIEKAINSYRKHLEENSEDVEVLSNLAYLLRKTDKDDESRSISKKVLALSHLNPRAYNNMAFLARKNGNISLARTILLKGIKHHPENLLLLNNMAAFYIESDDFSNAGNTLARIKSINSYDETYNTNYIYTLLKSQNYEEGLSLAQKYWDIYAKLSPANYFNLGLAYLSLEKQHEALLHINTNLKFAGPYRKEAQQILSTITKRSKE